MVFNTVTVGAAITPAVIETYFSHVRIACLYRNEPQSDKMQYLNRKPLHQKPTAHVSYHEGINLIRNFLTYASHHRVEDIQGFTSQWVPSPRWIRVEEVTLPEKEIAAAAQAIILQLGHHGIDKIGGEKWWQWRREGSKMQAEWIEMRRDFDARKGSKSNRVMLYVHGGAYFFGSVDEHRYQLQRHARKLEARVFAPRYRLSPQFPFPCGLLDCLAAYLYLLTVQSPNEIILAGDSAGGGMVLSILVTLRDQGIALPAGAILISPWVDLTHSFPSVAQDSHMDFIPPHGFLQRPSASWPPPNADDMKHIALDAVKDYVGEHLPRKSSQHERQEADEAVLGFSVDETPQGLDPLQNRNNPAGTSGAGVRPGNTIPGAGHDLSIMIDSQLVGIKDQIQMYTTNQLISHPLVSPVLQPSLGGLPPLLIQTGGGEILRDEQIYLAHKAANPSKYPPGDVYLEEYADAKDIISKWKPTDVQLQVWDDLCHVAPTLSFTRPAKFMYRSIAQFGAWALARAQKTDIEIQDDDDMSVISSGSESQDDDNLGKSEQTKTALTNGVAQGGTKASDQIGKAGDALPPFRGHMIRQRVDRHGNIFPLDPPSSLPALQISPNEVGVIKPGPVSKWLAAKKEWDSKYAREKRKVQKERAKELAAGYQTFGNDEVPPPSALAGRRHLKMAREEKKGRSWGMSLWSLWGSSHDEHTMEREEKADKEDREVATSTATEHNDNIIGADTNKRPDPSIIQDHSRSRSRRRTVSYTPQADDDDENINKIDENTPAAELLQKREDKESKATNNRYNTQHLSPHQSLPPTAARIADEECEYINRDAVSGEPSANLPGRRPAVGPGKAFPFKLGSHIADDGRNASTITLQSHVGGAETPGVVEDEEPTKVGGTIGDDENVRETAQVDD